MDELSPPLQSELIDALDRYYASHQPEADFSRRLDAQLRQHQAYLISDNRKRMFFQSSRSIRNSQTRGLRPMMILALLFLALLTITGVVYAVGRLTGFISGFGFTAGDHPVFVLAEPVEVTSGDVTLRAIQAVDDGERFWVGVTIEGFKRTDPFGHYDFPVAVILLPDGTRIKLESGTSSTTDGTLITINYQFPPLAEGTSEVSLYFEGAILDDLNLKFKLRLVEPGEIVPLPKLGSAPARSETHGGMQLVLDNVAVDHEKTVFQVSLRFDQPDIWIGGSWTVKLTDESGNEYPLMDITPHGVTDGKTQVYQTVPFTGSEQLLLTLAAVPQSDSFPLIRDCPNECPSFSLDLGANPQTGQTWELNRNVVYGEHEMSIINVVLEEGPILTFKIKPGSMVTGAWFYSTDHIVHGATGGGAGKNGYVFSKVELSEIPDRPIEFRLSQIFYQVEGSWSIRWQPPAAPAEPPNSPIPSQTPTEAFVPTPTLNASNPIVQEVMRLSQKYQTQFKEGAGWVHLVQETIPQPPDGQSLPPSYVKNEQWVEVDDSGKITQSVWMDFDETGTLTQLAASVGNTHINFTMGISGQNPGNTLPFSFDLMTPGDLSAAIERGSDVTSEEVPCDDGGRCLMIMYTSEFKKPVTNFGLEQAHIGDGRRVWINLETGQQVKDQGFYLLEDGSELLIATSKIVLVEKVDEAPEEIMDILAKVIVP